MTAAGTPAVPITPTGPLVRTGTWWRGQPDGADSGVPALDRIVRRLGLSIGVGGVIMGLIDVPEIISQAGSAPAWWTPVAALVVLGGFPVLAAVSIRSRPTVIRAVAGASALGYLVGVVTLPLALQAHTIDAPMIWLPRMQPLGALAAALAWPLRLSAGYLLVGSLGVAASSLYLAENLTVGSVLGAFGRAIGLATLLVWCVLGALEAARRVDRAAARSSRQAASSAAATARDRERSRFAALIHDAVLSTLLDASRGNEQSTVLRRQAEQTLEQLDEIRVATREPEVLDARAAVIFLRAAVHEINPDIRFATRTWPGFDDLRMPVHAATTVSSALGEAVRNSLRHAEVPGRAVVRTVTCTISAGSIRLLFADDGPGFDAQGVPEDRLGISVSILGRMRQLAGGAGFVESQPGEGTTVTLVWGGDGSQ